MSVELSDGVIAVTEPVDEQVFGGLLVRVMVICAAVALLDGSNTTSIGVAAPLLAEHLGLSQPQLGPIFSAATFGAMLGALSFGPLADRFGRKRMLVLATLIFGLFTIATARVDSFGSLLVVRFAAGIGLGGAAPCFIALAAEYAPSSRRAVVTSLIWSAFPMGVILGAMLNAYILAHTTWPAIFSVGGAMSLIVCLIVLVWLPESRHFLLVRRPHSDEIRRINARLGSALASGERTGAAEASRAASGSLFWRGRAVETMCIWVAFMAAFGMTAATFFWSPILLHNHGMSLAKASLMVGAGAGLGSLIGAASAGFLLQRIGPTTTLASTFLLATITTAALGYSANSALAAIINVVANGVLIAGVSTSGMLAFSADFYPVEMRSTGVGWAMGFGRFGEVLTPLLIAGLITIDGALDASVFLVLALVPFLGALSLLVLRNRQPAVPRLA